MENGENVNKKNKDGCTPLHNASKKGYIEVVKLLVEHGADISARTKLKRTAEDVARIAKRSHIVSYLAKEKKKMKNILSTEIPENQK